MAWHCKPTGGYSRESQEAYDNAVMAWGILSARSWSLLAFCAMWGNVEHESVYNPWRWQNDNVLASTDTYYIENQTGHAYGLVQWDEASKYIYGARNYAGYGPNFSNQQGRTTEGTAQLNFLDDTAVSSGQYFPNPLHPYQISYDNFKAATIDNYSIDWMVHAWFWNYERGTWNDVRTQAATYWYNVLSDVPPSPGGRIPIWLLFKIKKRNEGDYS